MFLMHFSVYILGCHVLLQMFSKAVYRLTHMKEEMTDAFLYIHIKCLPVLKYEVYLF